MILIIDIISSNVVIETRKTNFNSKFEKAYIKANITINIYNIIPKYDNEIDKSNHFCL